MSIKIGPIELENPVILAPMTGVTDAAFRSLVAEFGVAMVVSEMIAGKESLRDAAKSRERARRGSDGLPFVVQLAGCEPALMAAAARHAEAEGADIIDINMGCPVKKVVNGIGGSALMRDEALAAAIIAQTVRAVDLPVTLKMRTGWDHDKRNAPALARIAQDLGVQMVTVHGRTRQQMYNGRADWDFIAEVKAAVGIPVIANGDVKRPADARALLSRSGADGVMIGRGSFGRPWFPAQVAEFLATGVVPPAPDPAKRKATLLRHYDALLSDYGSRRGLRIARKHIGWYLEDIGIERPRIQALQRLEEPPRVIAGIKNVFDDLDAAARAA